MADPDVPSIVYVAGNAGALVWRVDVMLSLWVEMYGNDTSDNSAPHCDCRNWAWDSSTNSTLLVSDGGVFMRTNPRVPGGVWRGIQGNMTAMEFYNAAWDSRENRWIAGAQDNCVIYAGPNAAATDVALCAVGGDGTVVAVG